MFERLLNWIWPVSPFVQDVATELRLRPEAFAGSLFPLPQSIIPIDDDQCFLVMTNSVFTMAPLYQVTVGETQLGLWAPHMDAELKLNHRERKVLQEALFMYAAAMEMSRQLDSSAYPAFLTTHSAVHFGADQ